MQQNTVDHKYHWENIPNGPIDCGDHGDHEHGHALPRQLRQQVVGALELLRGLAGEALTSSIIASVVPPLTDVVARAIVEEMTSHKEPYVFLDLASHYQGDRPIRERFPAIAEECDRHGIDISRDRIPVVPAAHLESCMLIAAAAMPAGPVPKHPIFSRGIPKGFPKGVCETVFLVRIPPKSTDLWFTESIPGEKPRNHPL